MQMAFNSFTFHSWVVLSIQSAPTGPLRTFMILMWPGIKRRFDTSVVEEFWLTLPSKTTYLLHYLLHQSMYSTLRVLLQDFNSLGQQLDAFFLATMLQVGFVFCDNSCPLLNLGKAPSSLNLGYLLQKTVKFTIDSLTARYPDPVAVTGSGLVG